MFGKSFRSTLTKLTSGVKEAANKTASAIKHKGSVVDIPDEEYESVQDIEWVDGSIISENWSLPMNSFQCLYEWDNGVMRLGK